MEEQRKPTRWWLWFVVALALLVAYPVSLGTGVCIKKVRSGLDGMSNDELATDCIAASRWNVSCVH